MKNNQNWFYTSQVETLRKNIDKNIEGYKAGKIELPFDKEAHLANIFQPEGLVEKMLENADASKDFEAAILLYEAYPNLTTQIASMERFWSYLTHVDLMPYVAKRWDFSKSGKESNYVIDHWFCRDIMRNALAGLWWSVKVSVDESNIEDKYHLTRVFFKSYSLRVTWLKVLLRLPNALHGMLQHMEEHRDVFEGKYEIRGRYLANYLNRLGSTTLLSAMPQDYFKKVCDDIIDTTRTINNRENLKTALGDFRLEQGDAADDE